MAVAKAVELTEGEVAALGLERKEEVGILRSD